MTREITNPQENLKFCEDTIKMVVQANLAYIITAKRLEEIASKRLYLPRWESFDDFAMECLKESKGKVNTLLNIYRKFVIQGEMKEVEVSEVGWTILGKALPLIHSKEDAHHWLEQAKEQTPSNFNRMVKEAKTGKDMTTCEHKDKYMLEVCNDCKDNWEIHDIAAFKVEDLQWAIEYETGQEVTYSEAEKIFKLLTKKAYNETTESIPATS